MIFTTIVQAGSAVSEREAVTAEIAQRAYMKLKHTIHFDWNVKQGSQWDVVACR